MGNEAIYWDDLIKDFEFQKEITDDTVSAMTYLTNISFHRQYKMIIRYVPCMSTRPLLIIKIVRLVSFASFHGLINCF